VFAAGVLAGLYTLALLQEHNQLGSYDLGYFRQAAWLIAHGAPAFVTIRGLYLLGDHASPIFYPIGWMSRPFPPIPFLLFVQSAALALGVVPLWGICRRLAGLTPVVTTCIAIAYALYPAVQNLNLDNFHPEVIAIPLLMASVLFALTKRWLWYWVCIAVVLLCKEDMTIVVASLGLFLVLERERRVGLLTLAVGVVMFVVDTRVIQAHFAGGFIQTAFLSQYGGSITSIAKTMVLHPSRVGHDFFTSLNARLAIALLSPLLFLPLLAPRYLLPALPLEFFYLVSTRHDAHTIYGHYTAAILPFLFIALAMGVGTVARWSPGRIDGTRLVVVVSLVLVVAGYFGNARWSVGGVPKHPWAWRHEDAADRARSAAARLIPAGASVSGTVRVWQLVADRRDLYNFPGPFVAYESLRDPVPLAVREANVAYLFIDTSDGAQWQPPMAVELARIVQDRHYRLIFDRDGIELFEHSA